MKKIILSSAICLLASSSIFGQLYNQTTSVQATIGGTNGTYVGVNTNAPKDLFQVGSGVGKVSMGSAYYGHISNWNNWGSSYIGFNVTKTANPLGSTTWLTESDGGSNGGAMIYGSVGGGLNFVNFKSSSSPNISASYDHQQAKFATTMRIEPNGKVGIGTLSTTGNVLSHPSKLNAQGQEYLLYVKGGIVTEEIKVELGTGSWADYVFKSDYKLLSLPEVAAHIAEKGHLPNTPSAAELEEKGVELKAATINQQEKIEEIFLHLIEMDKKIKQLEAENAALKQQLIEKKGN